MCFIKDIFTPFLTFFLIVSDGSLLQSRSLHETDHWLSVLVQQPIEQPLFFLPLLLSRIVAEDLFSPLPFCRVHYTQERECVSRAVVFFLPCVPLREAGQPLLHSLNNRYQHSIHYQLHNPKYKHTTCSSHLSHFLLKFRLKSA